MSGESPVPFRFRVEQGEAVVTQFTGGGGTAEIPERWQGVPVTAVGSYAFFDNGSDVRRIRVPGSVRNILPHAFELCISLEQLTLEEGVEELGEDCLLATDVRELRVPSTLRRIHSPCSLPCRLVIADGHPFFSTDGYGVYEGDTLICVNPHDERECYRVREGTRVIRRGVFEDRPALRRVLLPASLESLGEGVLSNVRNQYSGEKGITEAEVDGANPYFGRDGNCLFRKLPDGKRIVRWFGEDRRIDLPEDVREIGREAFAGIGVEAVSFPATVREIAPDAFRGCPLREARVRGGDFGVVFPAGNAYLLKDLLRGFGRGGKLYEFSGYDAKLDSWYPDAGRVEMILARLRMPRDLTEERKAFYRETIASRTGEVIRLIASESRPDLLRELAEEGFLDDRLAEEAVRVMNGAGLHEMTAYLMNWKNTHLEKKEFDYSL